MTLAQMERMLHTKLDAPCLYSAVPVRVGFLRSIPFTDWLKTSKATREHRFVGRYLFNGCLPYPKILIEMILRIRSCHPNNEYYCFNQIRNLFKTKNTALAM